MAPKGGSENVPKEFRCAATGKALYLPVITTDGIAYSYAALFEMFMQAEGQPICKVTKEIINFFPAVCQPLHHFMWDQYRSSMRSRRTEEEAAMWEKFGIGLPNITTAPEDEGDEGFLEEFECVVSGEMAYEPCALSSGSIVSAYCVPEDGFKKDPNRLIACALYGQAPKKSATLEAMIRDKFPKEYSQRASELAKAGIMTKKRESKPLDFDPQSYIHMGLGCDGCGIWPIRGRAWTSTQCPESVGFHLCEDCYTYGYNKRVITGRFNQSHMPNHKMVPVVESGFF